MKFNVISSRTNKVLDTVTLTESGVSYRTGKAQEMVDLALNRMSNQQAQEQFKNWSNGYVSTVRVGG